MGSFVLSVSGLQQVTDTLKKQAKKFESTGHVCLVGINEKEGSQVHPDGENETIAQIASKNQFGGKTSDGRVIPARPFVDKGVDSVKQKIVRDIEESMAKGSGDVRALSRAGLIAVGGIRQYMTDLRTPPNAPMTIALKGSDNPLIDTGLLRNSITSVIVKGAK